MPAEPVETTVTVDDGARLWTIESGPSHGPPIVLCHGGPGLWDYLGPVAAMLDGQHRVRRFDQRGCGRSTGPHDYRMTRAVDDLEALRRHWGHDRWIVFGHSWGATLALAYAHAHPERVRGVVYCSGTGPGNEWRAPYRAERARRMTPEQQRRRAELEDRERSRDEEVEYRMLCWLPDFAAREEAEAWARTQAEAPFAINWQANRELAADEPDLLALGPTITAPTLIVHGALDPRPLANSRRLVDILPNATFEVIPAAGHWPWCEAPAALAAHCARFLATLA
ncbi:alpha/beta fold hydrolase [Nannocystis pusilla]|uniref:alpha/beta fold hydrolase n=1 Tax=Nannocystis pusilla TaxID=889268 RepID=UPI003BF164BE